MVQDGTLIEENVRQRSYDVDQNFDGWRLDEFLANRIDGMSSSLATRVADEGDVEVSGDDDVCAETTIEDGDVVVVRQHLEPEYVQDDEVETLYADDQMMVLDKPAGMLIHETATVRLNTVTKYLERRGLEGAEPAHRLDAETSGALVCARRQEHVSTLRRRFAGEDPTKIYRALAVDPEGRWSVDDRETLDAGLGKDDESELPHKMGAGDLEAITHVEVVDRLEHPKGELADLRIEIETGRQHQIRVHLAMESTPVAGDKMYGVDDEFFMEIYDRPNAPELLSQLHFDRHALHARRIAVTHPVADRRVEVEAPLPDIWSS